MMRWLRKIMDDWFSGQVDRDEAWRYAPIGCCSCGTGGPYYPGGKRPVVRYLYTGVMAGGLDLPPALDWSACSQHPLRQAPAVDLGRDVVISLAEAQDVFWTAVSGRG